MVQILTCKFIQYHIKVTDILCFALYIHVVKRLLWEDNSVTHIVLLFWFVYHVYYPHLLDPSSVTIPRPSALFCLSKAFKSRTLQKIKDKVWWWYLCILCTCISYFWKIYFKGALQHFSNALPLDLGTSQETVWHIMVRKWSAVSSRLVSNIGPEMLDPTLSIMQPKSTAPVCKERLPVIH